MKRAFALILLLVVLRPSAQEAPPFLVEAAFDTSRAYPGQALVYTVTAYSDTARDVEFDLPSFEGFWQADGRGFSGSATVNGKQYNTAIYQVSLYPQYAGRIEVGEAKAIFAETVFSAGATRLSNATDVEVVELPPTDLEFSGMVGVVAAHFSAEPLVVALGQPVTLTLRLIGTANLAQLPPPVLIASDGWRIYEEPRVAESAFDGGLITQFRTLRWQAVPDRAGRASIGVPPLVYFEAGVGYETIELAPAELEVLPGPNGELSREEITQVVDSMLAPAEPSQAAASMPAALWLLAPAVGVATVGGRESLRRWRRRQVETCKRTAFRRAIARLRGAGKDGASSDAIEAAVTGYFADRQINPALEPDVMALLIDIESERYRPDGAVQVTTLARRAAEILKRVEAAQHE